MCMKKTSFFLKQMEQSFYISGHSIRASNMHQLLTINRIGTHEAKNIETNNRHTVSIIRMLDFSDLDLIQTVKGIKQA